MRGLCLQCSATVASDSADFALPASYWVAAWIIRSSALTLSQLRGGTGAGAAAATGGGRGGGSTLAGGAGRSAGSAEASLSAHRTEAAATTRSLALPASCDRNRWSALQSCAAR